MNSLKPYILIIEDNAFIAADVERILTDALMCEVSSKSFGAVVEDIDQILGSGPDLIVLEIGFEQADRHEFAKRIVGASTPLIITTTSEEFDSEACVNNVPILRKPYGSCELITTITRMLAVQRREPAKDLCA